MVIAASLMGSASIRHRMTEIPPQRSAWLLLGAALITGCFFAGQSVGYRGLLFLLILPGLLWLQQAGTPRRLLLFSKLTTAAILLAMYRLAVIGLFARRDLYPGNSVPAALTWLCFELLWWGIIGMLLGLMGCLLIESRSARDIGKYLPRKMMLRARA
jgi:hypothetical protein